MGVKSIEGNAELAKRIRARRTELNLTIEEAASRAGVGTKTWSRYEAGESIRKDKCTGICKALNWHTLLEKENADSENTLDLEEYEDHEAWSKYLENEFGKLAAVSFVVGSDIVLDNLEQDMEALSSMPKGTHVGQIGTSWLEPDLPPQFLMHYDYEFLYAFKNTVIRLRAVAHRNSRIVAHSVLEELALYVIVENSRFLMESADTSEETEESAEYASWDEWIFDLFDDMDVITFLYSDMYLSPDDSYHFDHWMERQFFCDR